MMPEILGWANLGTAAGVAAAVAGLTQILKRYIPKTDPKWIALGLAIVITILHQMVTGDYNWSSFVLSALNAVISAGTAVGLYEAGIKPVKEKMHNS